MPNIKDFFYSNNPKWNKLENFTCSNVEKITEHFYMNINIYDIEFISKVSIQFEDFRTLPYLHHYPKYTYNKIKEKLYLSTVYRLNNCWINIHYYKSEDTSVEQQHVLYLH
jgi:hypothetical protein